MAKYPRISFVHSKDAPIECDAAVVFDVLRAFTTATYAFLSGASEILIANDTDDARLLKQKRQELITLGEVGSIKPSDFDYGNSPGELAGAALKGRSLVQATSSGTKGLVLYRDAPILFACSFACAGATAAAVVGCRPEHVALVSTGPDGDGADEDRSCAEYLAELIAGRNVGSGAYLERVRNSDAAQKFLDPDRPELDPSDVDYAMRLDVANFALCVTRTNSRELILRRTDGG